MKEFIFPSKFIWEKESYSANYGKLIVEPLEKGFGVTIGNTLRRILLSSIPGIAITGIKIEGVSHEFSTIKGVKEDVVEIILNLKQVALKPIISQFPYIVQVKISGKPEICAKDIITDGSVEVLNGDLHIATIDPSTTFKAEIEITSGFGYLPTEQMKLLKKEVPVGTILIDGIYTPVRKVTFHIENTRVGQFVDYEKLILEVWTTGAITPEESVKYATSLINKHFNLVETQQKIGEEIKEKAKKEEIKKEVDLNMPISELKFSTRVYNALSNKNIKTLGQLLKMTKEEFKEIRNLGKKSIEEIEDVLKKRGYKLFSSDELSGKDDRDET